MEKGLGTTPPTGNHPAMLEALEAQAFRTLRTLAGFVQDGSDTTVKLFQDDATMEWTVRAGKRSWHGTSLLSAISQAHDELRADEAAEKAAAAAQEGGDNDGQAD